MRTLRIYSLNNFNIHHNVNYVYRIVHYILVFIYNWKFVSFGYLHVTPLPPSSVSDNHKSGLSLWLFVFSHIIDLQYYVNSWCGADLFNISIYYKMKNKTGPVTNCQHTKIYTIIDYIPHTEKFLPCLFSNYKFLSS